MWGAESHRIGQALARIGVSSCGTWWRSERNDGRNCLCDPAAHRAVRAPAEFDDLGKDAGWIKFGYTPGETSLRSGEAKRARLARHEERSELRQRPKSAVWIQSRGG